MPSEQAVVPDGWVATTVGELGRYLNGRGFKRSEWSKVGRPIIRIQDLTGSHENPNYFEGEVEDRHVVRPGDLLISWAATLGAFVWPGPEGVLNQHIFKVESDIDPRYHYHVLRDRIAELQRNAHGSGMVHVTKGTFEATPVIIPGSKDLQVRLAEVIDAADACTASASGHLATSRTAVRRLRQAVLAAACTGQLTANWREANPDAELPNVADIESVNRRKRRQTEQAVELDLPDVPESYAVAAVGACALTIEYGTSKKCSPSPDVGVAVVRMGNIRGGRLDLADLKYCPVDAEIEKLILEDGDLLFNRTNSPELVGKSAVYRSELPASFASYLIRVRLADNVALPDFVNYWLESAWGRAWANLAKTDGVSQSNINGSKLALMPLPLPPIEEQAVIVQRAASLLAVADELEVRVDAGLRAVRRSSQAVLAKACRGELPISLEAA